MEAKGIIIGDKSNEADADEWFAALDYGYTHLTVALLGCRDYHDNVYVLDEHAERFWIPERHAHAIKAMLGRHHHFASADHAREAILARYPNPCMTSQQLWYWREKRMLARFVAGADMFSSESSGASIATQYRDLGLKLRPADMDRLSGRSVVSQRFGDPAAGIPATLFIHQRCQRPLETLPYLQHDPDRPGDILKSNINEDGAGGDDAADALRYLVFTSQHIRERFHANGAGKWCWRRYASPTDAHTMAVQKYLSQQIGTGAVKLTRLTLLFLVIPTLAVVAAESPFLGTPSGRVLAAGDRRVMILAPSGEVLWQYPAKLTHDVWMLASGNVLFADGETVTEVTPDKKVVFQYKAAEQKGGGTFACQRLNNGNTMIGENSTGRILEVDAAGRIVFSLQTQPSQVGQHHNLRMVRKLASGNYLACHSGARLVKEYTPSGQVVWEVKVPGSLAFAALRTPQNTTLVSSLDQLTEYDAKSNKVWEFSCKDVAPVSLQNLTGLHWLANGHVVSGCYRAYRDGAGCGLLEISRDGKISWRYTNPKADGTMMAVQLLSPDGAPLPGPCLR